VLLVSSIAVYPSPFHQKYFWFIRGWSISTLVLLLVC